MVYGLMMLINYGTQDLMLLSDSSTSLRDIHGLSRKEVDECCKFRDRLVEIREIRRRKLQI